VAIKSRLLSCKAEKGEALYYTKLALRVDPYFQVLALLKLMTLLAFVNQLYSNHFNYQQLITNQASVTNN
jgi:hypothetical protein